MNYRSFSATVVSVLLILLYQNCGNDAQSVRSTSSSPSTTDISDNGNGSSGGSTTGGSMSGGSTTGGTTTGGSTSGGTPAANVFPRSLNFNFRREDRIVMPINALMPLPYDVSGEFTVLSIVSSDLFRIRKYLGNTIDIGTKIPVMARRGDTGITLTFNHVATEYLRDRAIITLMSQANPNVLPQQVTITIEPKDTDFVDGKYALVWDTMKRSYDGKLTSSKSTATNLAPIGKAKLSKGIHPYPGLVQELSDGRTFVSAIPRNDQPPAPVNKGYYLNEKISSYSVLGDTVLALAEDKNGFYYGDASGDPRFDSIPINTQKHPSPVGPLKDIFMEPFSGRLLMLTESGKVYSLTATISTTTPRRFIFSNPVEINFGTPIVKGFYVVFGNTGNGSSQVAFVTSQNKIIIQNGNSATPSNVVIDMGTEPGSIDELVVAYPVAYVRFSTGKHYSVIFNQTTGAITNKYPCTHNPDLILMDYWNTNYTVMNPQTGQIQTVSYR
ncbi:hypothetical protein K2X05_06620 [bacterium]|nr:hypothetical protein [bacterium]